MATDLNDAVPSPGSPVPTDQVPSNTGMINTPTPAPVVAPTTPGSLTTATGTPPTSTYTAAQAGVTPYVVPTDATVASQINDIIASGSPLMQQAEAKAKETMNARGLMNSSMAVTAGQTGLINTALPIAQQDAATKAKFAEDTANATNTNAQSNVAQTNAALGAGATQSNTLQNTRLNNESAIKIQELQNAGNLANIQAQGVINTQIAKMQDDNKLLLQSNAGAASLYSQGLAYMAQISTNPNLDPGQKTTALNNAVQELSDALHVMSVIGCTPEVASTLNFGNSTSNTTNSSGQNADGTWPASSGNSGVNNQNPLQAFNDAQHGVPFEPVQGATA